jgi:hypothetical protein
MGKLRKSRMTRAMKLELVIMNMKMILVDMTRESHSLTIFLVRPSNDKREKLNVPIGARSVN